jgi:SH3 domain protein
MNQLAQKMRRIILLLLLCAMGALQAEPRYISDKTYIKMLAGEGPSEQMLRMLPAGEKVDLISSNSETGYSKIRDSMDRVGFVLSSQLMKNPSARERLTKVQKQYKALKQKTDNSNKPYKELQQKYQELTKELETLKASKESLDSELQERAKTSDDVARISEERKELRKKLATQTWEMENLKQEYQEFKNDRSQYWFLIGGGVALLGIILGMILPRLQGTSKKQTW